MKHLLEVVSPSQPLFPFAYWTEFGIQTGSQTHVCRISQGLDTGWVCQTRYIHITVYILTCAYRLLNSVLYAYSIYWYIRTLYVLYMCVCCHVCCVCGYYVYIHTLSVVLLHYCICSVVYKCYEYVRILLCVYVRILTRCSAGMYRKVENTCGRDDHDVRSLV